MYPTEQDSRQPEILSIENGNLRQDVHGAQQSILRLLDEKKESAERIRELQDSNDGLEEEVANMRAKLSFATDTIINEIQDRIDTATFAGPTVRVLKEQIAEQTNTIEKLKTQKKRVVTELSQLQLQSKKKRRSSKETKIEKVKSASQSAPSDDNTAATSPSLASTSGNTPCSTPSAREFVSYSVEKVMRERLVPGEHLTVGVIFQLQRALRKKTKEGKNVYSFINRGKIGRYHCFHEVCEKGPDASVEQRLADAGCQFGSDKCNFLVKAVIVGSHRKLQIYNPAVGTSA
jgi:regulator of replication initiation timing